MQNPKRTCMTNMPSAEYSFPQFMSEIEKLKGKGLAIKDSTAHFPINLKIKNLKTFAKLSMHEPCKSK